MDTDIIPQKGEYKVMNECRWETSLDLERAGS